MPAENLAEEALAKNPNLELSQLKYELTTELYRNNAERATKLLAAIEESNMAPFYEEVCCVVVHCCSSLVTAQSFTRCAVISSGRWTRKSCRK